MLKHYILDDNGEPKECDMLTAAVWNCEHDPHVGDTKIGPLQVSTVFLGMDLSFGRGAPQFFETMIFGGKLDQNQVRYATRAEALAGHERMVEKVVVTERTN